MSDPTNPLIDSLSPVTTRVRTDVTALRRDDGRMMWTREPLTRDLLAKHLNGGPARGVCPIAAGADVTLVAALDFDSHRGEVSWARMSAVVGRVVDVLEVAWGAEPILWRSRGGSGVHLYLLWDVPQRARDVREWLRGVLAAAGLRPGTGGVAAGQVEVFPKQDSVPADGFGSQIILPLAGKSVPLRWLDLAEWLEPLPREAALGLAWPASPPVPPAPERRVVERSASDSRVEGLDRVAAALAAIPNDGPGLDYDRWRDVIYAVHEATGGAPEGLDLVETWSARSSKYVAGYAEAKVWNPASADREGGITRATLFAEARAAGWIDPSEMPNPDDWGVVGQSEAALATGEAPPPERKGIPEAKHLCTDQANAVRLVKAFGSDVLVAAGRWHVWDGCRWRADEADVYRMACRLSAIIKAEAAEVLARARKASEGDGSAARLEKAAETAEALEKWSTRSESKATIEAALGLARKMLTVDVELLDANPWLLNCRNGVVDLRTGEMREHRAEDLITKFAPVEYRGMGSEGESGAASEWQEVVRQIAGTDAVAAFLQRWFGYCCTGDTREQVFVVHWGDGSNGKSTIIETIAHVLGDYAATAAPGLLVGGEKERHPTEIADLQGRRMVTAHETREGVVLRDDFVKQATGGDKLKARYMREDFFEFRPTHKLQLLTNSKPTVRGQDHGIWRRVRLVAYSQRFGSAEDVAAGRATLVRDGGLMARLAGAGASTAVLGWLVAGAVEWFRGASGTGGGLREPDAVLEASEAYRSEQDRVRLFLRECCELRGQVPVQGRGDGGSSLCEALTLGFTGLYPAYVAWCKEAGNHALSRQRFLSEMLRAEPGLQVKEEYGPGANGGRRKITRVYGIRLLPE